MTEPTTAVATRVVTRFSCEITKPPTTKKIDLNDAYRLLAEISQRVEPCPESTVRQLVVLRDNFMRAAYATNRPHRKTRKPTTTTKKELV